MGRQRGQRGPDHVGCDWGSATAPDEIHRDLFGCLITGHWLYPTGEWYQAVATLWPHLRLSHSDLGSDRLTHRCSSEGFRCPDQDHLGQSRTLTGFPLTKHD